MAHPEVFVAQTSAIAGKRIFNDKDWVAADPTDPTGNTAYVAWNLDKNRSSAIVISKTTDGGLTWSVPKRVSNVFTTDISATVVVGNDGTVYVTFEATTGSGDAVAFAVSHNGGTTFTTKLIAPINDIPSPLPGATFRDNSFPALALDGSTLHVVWSNWNGTDADVVHMRSTNGGTTWSAPIAIGGGPGDQFFPWIAARHGTVYASWFNRASGDTYTIAGAASSNGGATWSAPATLSTATCRPATSSASPTARPTSSATTTASPWTPAGSATRCGPTSAPTNSTRQATQTKIPSPPHSTPPADRTPPPLVVPGEGRPASEQRMRAGLLLCRQPGP